MTSLIGKWSKLSDRTELQRSSHSLASDAKNVYIFGGELVARQPRDNDVFELAIDTTNDSKLAKSPASGEKPTPRVGATATAIHGKVYIFSGRGGIEMTPTDEQGALQVFNPAKSTWESIKPADPAAAVPEPRSYHCATTDGNQRIFIHAGCPEKGRLRDLWSFDIASRAWTKHADAPGAPRGGTSIVFADGKLWRMNGFDGKDEIGGAIDVFDLANDSWQTIEFQADGKSGPGARSVSSLVTVNINSKPHIVTMFGEADPSSLGHAGAGKMLEDAWAFDTHASVWKKIEPAGEAPQPRGWFDAAAVANDRIVVTGGLADSNERIADAWLLSVA